MTSNTNSTFAADVARLLLTSLGLDCGFCPQGGSIWVSDCSLPRLTALRAVETLTAAGYIATPVEDGRAGPRRDWLYVSPKPTPPAPRPVAERLLDVYKSVVALEGTVGEVTRAELLEVLADLAKHAHREVKA